MRLEWRRGAAPECQAHMLQKWSTMPLPLQLHLGLLRVEWVARRAPRGKFPRALLSSSGPCCCERLRLRLHLLLLLLQNDPCFDSEAHQPRTRTRLQKKPRKCCVRQELLCLCLCLCFWRRLQRLQRCQRWRRLRGRGRRVRQERWCLLQLHRRWRLLRRSPSMQRRQK